MLRNLSRGNPTRTWPRFFMNNILQYIIIIIYFYSLHQAESDCTEALKLDRTYVKALQRRATARERLGSLRSASADLNEVNLYLLVIRLFSFHLLTKVYFHRAQTLSNKSNLNKSKKFDLTDIDFH